MTADERRDDGPSAEAPAAENLVARVLYEVRAARAAILQAFERGRRGGVEWGDGEPEDRAGDERGGAR